MMLVHRIYDKEQLNYVCRDLLLHNKSLVQLLYYLDRFFVSFRSKKLKFKSCKSNNKIKMLTKT
jgi:hypothetical protein